jgi:pSer/pThr/pTyr-binding forkhead associated (FHA) protein
MLTLTIASTALGERSQQLTADDLLGEGATIGRAAKCQIVLEDPGISRSHARVSLNQGSVFLTDLGSTAGTTFNGSRLAPDLSLIHI